MNKNWNGETKWKKHKMVNMGTETKCKEYTDLRAIG